ncbi:hypothetical protein [Mumia sp. Pv 4-285]|uniref:hypothetical protein n=1 Tax=Mumia qirimensis TaxID=3234852 RepID=UPI00351D0E95
MEPIQTLAYGVELHLVSTEDGGRSSGLLGGTAPENRFTYRPNWGLPDWADGEQTAGPVFGFSRSDILPGDDTRAVLVALFIENVQAWHDVRAGDELRMYEGSRICGRAIVEWIAAATWPSVENDAGRFLAWLAEPRRDRP